MRLPLAALCLALLAAPAAAGEPSLTVEAVVSPAWLERDGGREPLAVGDAVEEGARIITGPRSRARLRMGEGSVVKLGEQVRFTVEALKREPRGDTSSWQATLDVARGAFRYTSARLAAAPERDFRFRVNTLVAGIRGTDVWGKVNDTKDVVVLIEGRVTVAHGSGEIALDKPRSVLAAPRDGATPAVSRITARQLAALAAETEILAGAGGAWSGGRYRVVVITTVDETYARQLHERLQAGGYPAELRAVEQEGSPVYQVYLADLGGEREARAVAQRLRVLGYAGARPAR